MPYFEDDPAELAAHESRFGTEEQCRLHVFDTRFPCGYTCPDPCGGEGFLIPNTNQIRCVRCRRRVSLLTGTIFQGTHKPLVYWFLAIFWLRDERMSAKQLEYKLGMAYDTCWRWMAKIRTVVQTDEMLTSIQRVEVERPPTPEAEPPECAICPGLRKVDWNTPAPAEVSSVRSGVRTATKGKATDHHIERYLDVVSMRRTLGGWVFYERLASRLPLSPPISYEQLIMPRAPRELLAFRRRPASRR